MPARKYLKGLRFGRWKVIEAAPDRFVGSNPPQKHSFSLCLCDCGVKRIVRNSLLINGNSKSCGCYDIEMIRTRSTTHGKYYTRAHVSWIQMIQRITNPNNPGFKNYGGRGIRVCKRWLKFENFWKDMGERPIGLSLERINNKTGHYYPSNCKWDTRKNQNRNQRSNRVFTVRGRKACVAELCEIFNKKYSLVKSRLHHKWPIERALFEPLHP